VAVEFSGQKKPAPHWRTTSGVGHTLPAGQGASTVLLAGQKLPAAHARGHRLGDGQYVPAAQSASADEFAGQHVPIEHGSGCALPAGQYLPAGHPVGAALTLAGHQWPEGQGRATEALGQ
jgi:hypothetical protein